MPIDISTWHPPVPPHNPQPATHLNPLLTIADHRCHTRNSRLSLQDIRYIIAICNSNISHVIHIHQIPSSIQYVFLHSPSKKTVGFSPSRRSRKRTPTRRVPTRVSSKDSTVAGSARRLRRPSHSW